MFLRSSILQFPYLMNNQPIQLEQPQMLDGASISMKSSSLFIGSQYESFDDKMRLSTSVSAIKMAHSVINWILDTYTHVI